MNIVDLREQRKEEEHVASPALAESGQFIKKTASYFWETFKVLIIALLIIVPIRLYVAQPFIVDGDSMLPNYHDGEYLIVDEISYRFSQPQRGEVIIFHPPNDAKNYYIKRMIGLPGETIELKDGKIFIYEAGQTEAVRLNELDYLLSSGIAEDVKITLKDGEYYVLGDNRSNSLDSRRFGPITMSEIKGKALLRAYPFAVFSLLKKPNYPSYL